MFGKCTRSLVFRWFLLAGSLCALAYLLYWVASGHLPADNILVSTPDKDVAVSSIIPGYYSPILVGLAAAAIAWAAFDSYEISSRWAPPKATPEAAQVGTITGCVLGAIGSAWILGLGFPGLVIGAFFTSFVISAIWCTEKGAWKYFWVHLWAVVTIWGLTTAYGGPTMGLIYAGATLGIAAVVHFDIQLLIWSFRMLSDPFSRTMLSCKKAMTSCPEKG